MKRRRVLITGVGGGGSNNLIASLYASRLDFKEYLFLGSNLKAEILAKSPLEENYILPVATDSNYNESLKKLIAEKKIDLVVPNNDREVAKISQIRDELDCRIFLPPDETVRLCQDKMAMHKRLAEAGIPIARTYSLSSLEDIEPAMGEIGGERFWIRPRTGSGSKGATWVRNAKQAKDWIELWVSLRGFHVDQFTVSEFLAGRDYACPSVWKDGKLIVAKMCERLEYFFGANRLSGMSSTPAVARTIRDEQALDTIMKTVHTLCSRPHGNFNFDLKGRDTGEMCITECNIGRFFMITPIFDLTGKYNTAEIHIRCAFDEDPHIEAPIDIEEGYFLLRDLDTTPTIVHETKLNELRKTRV